jgi:hypothetical protein
LKRARAEADYRRALAHRLREKSIELEDAIFDRIRAHEESSEQPDRSFEGLRLLIRSLVEYGAVAVECGERKCPPPPPAALEHARKAAWASMPPLTFHARYLAARSVFDRFLRQEARSVDGYVEGALAPIQESNDLIFECLFQIVGKELERELQRKRRSTATQQLERVQALLAGELLEAPELGYDFEATQIGIVGSGEGVASHVKQALGSLGRNLLLVQPSPQKCWAWVGTRSHLPSAQLEQALSAGCPASARIALGEPAPGITGWRQTHREAAAGLVVASRLKRPVVRHSEFLILAAILNNPVLSAALEAKYLTPLSEGSNGGKSPLKTLQAYYEANRSGKSAAAALNVSPQTVSNHLRWAEDLLGCRLDDCALELEAAVLLAGALESAPGQQLE